MGTEYLGDVRQAVFYVVNNRLTRDASVPLLRRRRVREMRIVSSAYVPGGSSKRRAGVRWEQDCLPRTGSPAWPCSYLLTLKYYEVLVKHNFQTSRPLDSRGSSSDIWPGQTIQLP